VIAGAMDRFPGVVRHWAVLRAAWAQETERARTRVQIDETAFLPAALEVMDTPASPIGRGLLWFLMLCVAAALFWSFIGRMDVVAVAPGKLVPASRIKTIQPTELGVVRAVRVREGQHVKAGEVLVELDPTIATAETRQAARALLAAEIDAARARAILGRLDGNTESFAPPPGTPADVVRVQETLIDASLAEHRARRAALEEQLTASEAERSAALREIAKLEETRPLLKQQLDARRELAKRGFGRKLELLDYESAYIEAGKNIGIAGDNARKAAATIAALRQSQAQLKQEFARDRLSELADAENRAAVARQDLAKAKERKALTRLTAPVAGTVQQLKLHTIGGVVQPAEALMTIVPDAGETGDKGLIAEALVLNRDIGFLRVGQNVAIKLAAFPFTDYGLIPGRLEAISRDAVEDEALGLVYTVRVRLECGRGTGDSRRERQTAALCRHMASGMAVSAEIKTTTRRIIDYFLSPIAKATSEAGRGR
jgi:hemolysin D